MDWSPVEILNMVRTLLRTRDLPLDAFDTFTKVRGSVNTNANFNKIYYYQIKRDTRLGS